MEAIERFAVSQDWITILLIGVLILLVTAKYAFPQWFSDFSMLFATNKYLLVRGKDPKIFHPFNMMMFTINVISVALIIFIFYETYTSSPIEKPKIFFLRTGTAYATFVLLKFSLEKIISNILNLDQKMDYFLFYKLSYRNFMALALLPVSIIFVYAWTPSLPALYICIGLILLINLIIVAGIFRKNQQYILSNWFYFILYLCALEIGPYFILYKLIMKM